MKLFTILLAALLTASFSCARTADAQTPTHKETSMSEHYTFQLDDKEIRTKVRFKNHFGIELAGDLYAPKNADGKLAALAVSGPFGAVKEQVSGLYAMQMAMRGSAGRYMSVESGAKALMKAR